MKITKIGLIGLKISLLFVTTFFAKTVVQAECNKDNYRDYIIKDRVYESYIEGCFLSGADLRELQSTLIWRANFVKANLNGADLRGVKLSAPDFNGADLSEAKLSGVSFTGASFYKADLSGADLSGSDLSGSDFYPPQTRSRNNFYIITITRGFGSPAKLSGANLSGADLSGADLRGTDLSDAQGLSSIVCDEDTDFPGPDFYFQFKHDIVCEE